jgi:ABC-type branched-subunit amino acid transport system ATPase component
VSTLPELTDVTAPALVVDAVSVEFGGVHAIKDVSLHVGPDDIVSIIGPNGAGKTTLLNAVCSVVPKSAGMVRHGDVDITRTHPSRIARGGVGRSFQDPQLLEDSTVLENILCGAHTTIGYSLLDQIVRRGRVHRREAALASEAAELLDLVGLRDVIDVDASELPYGPRKIVDIIRATIGRPSILLLDEPSSGLDRSERKRVEEMLLAIHDRYSIPMLVVEHHMDLVRRISDQVVGLISGAVAMSGRPGDVLDSAEFLALIVGATSSAAASLLPPEEG